MDNLRIPAGDVTLYGDIEIPDQAHGAVIFAHGSGSSRHSPRNRLVAQRLQGAGLATVLVDLLTPEEEQADRVTSAYRFNISLLAHRVTALADWVVTYEPAIGLHVGLFGASTGAAAALVTAAVRRGRVRAVVSSGGQPDLAGEYLRAVRQPTLLIVGSRDEAAIDLNRAAMHTLAGQKHLEIVPGATHLFTEPGALEKVADLATDWFTRYLTTQERSGSR